MQEVSFWATRPVEAFIMFSQGLDFFAWVRLLFRISSFVSYAATI